MKKTLYIIVLTFCFLLALVGKSYGQGWERTVIEYQNSSPTYPNIDMYPLNDGGCIVSFENRNYNFFHRDLGNIGFSTLTQGLFLNRFDKYGNQVWNNKPLYKFRTTVYDSISFPPLTDYDTMYGVEILQAIQLPNNNIVLLHNSSQVNASGSYVGNTNDKYFTLIDNFGNRLLRVHNPNDTLVFFNSLIADEKMYYNNLNNTIECVALRTISNDSILFVKSIYNESLIKIGSITKIIFKKNANLNFYSYGIQNQYISQYRSKNGNYFWYDNFYDGNNFNYYPSRILKLDGLGNMKFDTLIPLAVLNNTLATTTPINYSLNLDPINTRYPYGVDLDENSKNETSIVMSTYCWYDSIAKRSPFDVYAPITYKTRHLVFTLDSIGHTINTNIISSLIDTLGFINKYSDKTDVDQTLIKYVTDNSLLIVKVNVNGTTEDKSIWESIRINPSSGIITSQHLFKPLGNNGYYQYWMGMTFVKMNSKDNKNMFVHLYYLNPIANKTSYGIAKIDNNGYPFGNVITGNVFNDANNNCTKNTLEKGIPNYTVSATKNNFNNYGTTDKNGNYFIGLADSGNYTVAVRNNPMHPLWNSVCNPTQTVTVENDIAFDTANFALKPSILCPYNTVNVSSAPPFRIGQPNTYFVNYCNNGTIASPITYITLKLDSLLDIDTSIISYTTLPNHTYRFNIGNLDYLTCGNFSFVATPRIGVVQLNQTLCVEAHIFPDTICTTPNYIGAVIEASARCLGDSVQLQLQNVGSGNMSIPKKYIVIEGNVMRINQNYQLNVNQVLTETLLADSGQTYRIIADQPDGLPISYGDKFATAAIENCQPITNFPTGFFTQFPNYDGEPFRAMSCNLITGAYDPNDKVASPIGYAAQHFIEANTQIDYQINFQNTGNDTAFKVVLIDTISPNLDINSIQLGVASHRYQFQRTDSNVVQFVFDSIKLVDSFRNEKLSHGFIKFKIQQKLNNANGTKIYNKADIYFDYNAPITTNQTYHTIGQNFVQVNLITATKNIKFNVKNVKVFPNPFREKTQIIVESDALKNPILLLMNVEGKIIKTITNSTQNTFDIYREDLQNGLYIFKILQNETEVANGKIVVQ